MRSSAFSARKSTFQASTNKPVILPAIKPSPQQQQSSLPHIHNKAAAKYEKPPAHRNPNAVKSDIFQSIIVMERARQSPSQLRNGVINMESGLSSINTAPEPSRNHSCMESPIKKQRPKLDVETDKVWGRVMNEDYKKF